MALLTTDRLQKLTAEQYQQETLVEFLRCKNDYAYMIENYFTVLDPVLSQRVPFKLYPHQRKALYDFQHNRYNLTMKSRQMGLTTIAAAFVAAYMCMNRNKEISALATKLKTSKAFLKKVRAFLDDARKRTCINPNAKIDQQASWLISNYVKGDDGKESFTLKTNCHIAAESNNEDACRGETLNLLIIDEVATITKMEDIWSAAGVTLTRSNGACIGISTPKGQSGWYFEQYIAAEQKGWNIIDAHWIEHPDFSKGSYVWITNDSLGVQRLTEIIEQYKVQPVSKAVYGNGFLVFFNNDWPDRTQNNNYKTKQTYKYLCDGRLRSPWYDAESKKLGKEKTKCELDCSFAGSGSEVLDPEIIRALTAKAQNVDVVNRPRRGLWKSFKQFAVYNEEHEYLLSSDCATGDGSDFSAFVVIDLTTLEVVASYKEQLDPKAYATIINDVGRAYGTCLVVVEHQYGLTTLLDLKQVYSYPNLFYSTLKKEDPTDPGRRKKKIGFWQSRETKMVGGDKLEEMIINGELKFYSSDVISELNTWIWTKQGLRGHLEGKNDDLIMALTIAVYVICYVQTARNRRRQQTMHKKGGLTRGGQSLSPFARLNNEMFSDDI